MEQLRDQTKHMKRPDSNRRHHPREDKSSKANRVAGNEDLCVDQRRSGKAAERG